ncbi:sigma-70 family RNA polymerase sigma factor [Planctomicrobium sp. SH664]|uniref:sigma-70 family RNA polymerase sigma factor n=1 Tax=Planctomicrobium sp. SH664 TaxID=3448125 RepID=UPI003F5C0D15
MVQEQSRYPSASEVPRRSLDFHTALSQGNANTDRGRLFLRLFLQNQRRLYAYVLTLVPNRTDADDVMQEVSFLLWEKFDEQHVPLDFTAWGCRIAYFKVLDFFKRKRRSRVCFSQEMLERLAESTIEQAAPLQLDARREALADCMKKLSGKDQQLLQLRFMEGGSTESAANAQGRTVDAVYKALARVRHVLFRCITQSLQHDDEQC